MGAQDQNSGIELSVEVTKDAETGELEFRCPKDTHKPIVSEVWTKFSKEPLSYEELKAELERAYGGPEQTA